VVWVSPPKLKHYQIDSIERWLIHESSYMVNGIKAFI
jgi:hypothetical protein